jgi:hypothetical protein
VAYFCLPCRERPGSGVVREKACLYSISRSKRDVFGTSRERPRGSPCRATRFRTRKKHLETAPPCRFFASCYRSDGSCVAHPPTAGGPFPNNSVRCEIFRPVLHPVATLLPMPAQRAFIFEGAGGICPKELDSRSDVVVVINVGTTTATTNNEPAGSRVTRAPQRRLPLRGTAAPLFIRSRSTRSVSFSPQGPSFFGAGRRNGGFCSLQAPRSFLRPSCIIVSLSNIHQQIRGTFPHVEGIHRIHVRTLYITTSFNETRPRSDPESEHSQHVQRHDAAPPPLSRHLKTPRSPS